MIARTLAPAKLNLTLDVGSRRSDGYHDLRSVFVAIDVADEVAISPADEAAVAVEGDAGDTPTGVDNLAFKAARLIVERYDTPPLAVRLWKRIPAAGGLAGGSSDAAAVIRAANALFRLDLSSAEQAMLGARLGSDVPFFAFGGAALVEGRGGRVTPLDDARLWFVLGPAEAGIADKTRVMFGRLDVQERTPASRTDALLAGWPRVNPDGLGNDFEAVAFEAFEGLGTRRAIMEAAGARCVRLSGAGPTLFAVCRNEEEARTIAREAGNSGLTLSVTRTIDRAESLRVTLA
jgi:4-diphosphocytidyl-2-C-methyl-D-erythritol kinase